MDFEIPRESVSFASRVLAALSSAIVFGTVLPVHAAVPDGAIAFDNSTDTIQVAGGTTLGTTATIEARVFFPTGGSANGYIFNELTVFQEDKQLFAGTTAAGGYFHSSPGILQFNGALVVDVWHHVAPVNDGPNNEQRFYLDGAKVLSQAANVDIGDGPELPFIGAGMRDALVSAFLGYLDTLRVSDNARYSGDSFTPPAGDLADDANTLILYNFSAGDFTFDGATTTLADLSGNGHTGTLGTGFPSATSPTRAITLDIDGDGALGPLTDGLLALRYAFGFTGAALVTSAVGEDCTRCDAPAISQHLATLETILDVDDSDDTAPLTDALLVLSYLFGFTGASLTANAVANDCGRCDAASIEPYLQLLD